MESKNWLTYLIGLVSAIPITYWIIGNIYLINQKGGENYHFLITVPLFSIILFAICSVLLIRFLTRRTKKIHFFVFLIFVIIPLILLIIIPSLSPYDRDKILSFKADLTNNADLCEKISHYSPRDYCYYNIAIKGDKDLCDKITGGSETAYTTLKKNCYNITE